MENAYDETKYESYAYSQTHPEHLYTLAKLFQVGSVDFRKAKVLELGAASGGNLIPMAYNLPESQFLGIDLSGKQIQDGCDLVKKLKLSNIELREQSILDFHADEGQFDYIICHGIYSWVPPEVQDKILSIFKENLSPAGVAYISYNTMPGWSMVKSIREMMLYHTENIQDPTQKATQSRALLHFISEGLEGEDSSYADFLKIEIELLKKQPDSYLLHDHLEAVNLPIYFHELVERAEKYQLSYLSDAQLVSMFVGNLPPQFSKEISKVNSILVANQYMDFIRNQRFRSTLFCHNHVHIQRNLDVFSAENFYFSYAGLRDIKFNETDFLDGVELKFVGASITLTTKDSLTKHLIKVLCDSQKPISYDDLLKQVMSATKITQRKKVQDHINQQVNLLRLILGGLILIHSSEGRYIEQTTDQPLTTDLAVEQAKVKNYVINQRHEVIALNPMERMLLQRLDGKKNKRQHLKDLMNEIKQGVFQVLNEEKKPVTDIKDLETRLDGLYQQTLHKFSQCALLIQKGV